MSREVPSVENMLKWLTVTAAVLCVGIFTLAAFQYDTNRLEARLLPDSMRGITPWKTITDDEIEFGITIPADTNVIIHIPTNTKRIARKTLFGYRGERVRYWGYCFPENYELMLKMPGRSFPGRLFLSEAERDARREEERQRRRSSFQVIQDLQEGLLNETDWNRGRIRHQMDVFEPGATCYIMTEFPIPVGIDPDDDQANNYVERDAGCDPENPDTDGDGLNDGVEIFLLKTLPTSRDSDGDGLIDGLEDKDRDGMIEAGETDPTKRDSDGDNLCDGLCRVGSNGRELRGEDINLNGEVDEGETNPLRADSDGNGILDDQEYFNCLLESGDCNYSAFPIQ